MDLSGGSFFKDITDLFRDASEELNQDEMLMTDGFSLLDAMSAIEIGDPRMDSGADVPEDNMKQEFDSFYPLLPDEVCWILDRALACEMHWHAGHALSQTVYTCLYVHSLMAVNPDFMDPDDFVESHDEQHPLKLITIVLRAGIFGMVKCCDLGYQELVKGNVHDGEDWLGDKAEISLCEATQTETVLRLLGEAESWLKTSEGRRLPFQERLLQRIAFRKVLLRLFTLELPKKSSSIIPLVSEARKLLSALQQQSIKIPSDSKAHHAFDRRIIRHLTSAIPLKPLDLPAQDESWTAVQGMLDGWDHIAKLSSCESLLSWITASELRASNPKWIKANTAFLRSAAQTVFSNGNTILDRMPYIWVVDRFFLEIAHCQLSRLDHMFSLRWGAMPGIDFDVFQRKLAKMLVQQVWATFHNRPRYRRHLMKTEIERHSLYETAMALTSKVTPKDYSDGNAVQSMPLTILHWRVRNIKAIMLSGFELELYAEDEKPFAYWYLSKLFSAHERILSQLLKCTAPGSPAMFYLTSQAKESSALRQMCLAFFLFLCKSSKYDATRRFTNFLVRYKWASTGRDHFQDNKSETDILAPDFNTYLKEEEEILTGEQDGLESLDLINGALRNLTDISSADVSKTDPSLQLCYEDFTQHFVGGLLRVCENVKAILTVNSEASSTFALNWNRELSIFFPTLSCKSNS